MGRRGNGPRKGFAGPWYGQDRERLRFESEARRAYPHMRAKVVTNVADAGYRIRLRVEVPYYGSRRVEIRFSLSAPTIPRVYVDGPSDSPHRFPDRSLCMWHPGDPPSHRWVFEDGLLALIGYIVAHLLREGWWRERGEWPGLEAGHVEEKLEGGRDDRLTA